ncbi:MAG: hypothetical protein ACRDHZ_12130 [Ktedonobacteraceae bacterium]
MSERSRRLAHPAQRAEPVDQGLLQGGGNGRGLAAARQMPAQQLPGMAVDHQRQRQPAVTPPRCGTGPLTSSELR